MKEGLKRREHISAIYLLSILLLAAAWGIAGQEAYGEVMMTPEGIQYEVNGDEVTVTGFDWEKDNKNVVIPSVIDGLPVTAIGEDEQGYD